MVLVLRFDRCDGVIDTTRLGLRGRETNPDRIRANSTDCCPKILSAMGIWDLGSGHIAMCCNDLVAAPAGRQ